MKPFLIMAVIFMIVIVIPTGLCFLLIADMDRNDCSQSDDQADVFESKPGLEE